jgi:hypothetical protein
MKHTQPRNKLSSVTAVATGAVFFGLASLVMSPFVPTGVHSYLSSFPLGLAGISYGLLQLRRRLSRELLLKRLVLAGAFVGWAIDELLPAGPAAVVLGDVVIVGFVLDVMWLIRDQIHDDSPATPRSSSPVSTASSDRFNRPIDINEKKQTVTSLRE